MVLTRAVVRSKRGRVTPLNGADPLALYGLDYPKVPLLLVDFRNTRRQASGDGESRHGRHDHRAARRSPNGETGRTGQARRVGASGERGMVLPPTVPSGWKRTRPCAAILRWIGAVDPELRAGIAATPGSDGREPTE